MVDLGQKRWEQSHLFYWDKFKFLETNQLIGYYYI